MVVGPVVEGAGAGGAEGDDVVEPFVAEPGREFGQGVVGLVAGGVPVEVVADAEGPVGVAGKVDELVECAVEEGDGTEDAEAGAGGFEEPGGHAGGGEAQAGVEPFLGGGVAAVEPDGEAAAGFDEAGDLSEGAAGVGAVVEDADGEDGVEGTFLEGEVEEVGLEDGDVGEVGAEGCGFFDGLAEVDADDGGAVLAEQAGVAAAAAAGVEDELAGEGGGIPAGFDAEDGVVLGGAGDVVAVPLAAEAGDVGFAGEAGDVVDDGVGRATTAAFECGLAALDDGGGFDATAAVGALDDVEYGGVHGGHCRMARGRGARAVPWRFDP